MFWKADAAPRLASVGAVQADVPRRIRGLNWRANVMCSLCEANAFLLLPGWKESVLARLTPWYVVVLIYVCLIHYPFWFEMVLSSGGFGLHRLTSLGSDTSVGQGMRGRKILQLECLVSFGFDPSFFLFCQGIVLASAT